MDIGINYLTDEEHSASGCYDDVYKILIEKGYINTLKFPGRRCNFEEFEKFLHMVKSTDVKVDIHGLPGIVPEICSSNFLRNVDWDKIQEYIKKAGVRLTHISTHVGVENKDKLENYTEQTLRENFEFNFSTLKSKLGGISIGLENVPGQFCYDTHTLYPEYVSKNWKKADFGVFDITHAHLASKTLNITYDNYLERLQNTDKVQILHVSGNIDETGKYEQKPDKHVLTHKDEIDDIIYAIQKFKNLKLVVSEYVNNTKHSYKKEIVIESILLHTIVKTMDKEKSMSALAYLEKNLKDDISNIQEVLDNLN